MCGPVNCQLLVHTVISSFSAQELMTTYTQDIHLGENLNSWSDSEQRISFVLSLTDLKPPVLSGLTVSHSPCHTSLPGFFSRENEKPKMKTKPKQPTT